MTGLKADVSRGLGTVSSAAAAANSNIALIAELERVKTRMEAACSTLKVYYLWPHHTYGILCQKDDDGRLLSDATAWKRVLGRPKGHSRHGTIPPISVYM